MVELGVIHGRFQVLHNDHLKYLLAGKVRCRHLVVGITNPDPFLTRHDSADPQRSDPQQNPLGYFERYTMVRAVMRQAGIAHDDFSVVPFPVNHPDLYAHYVPLDAVFYLTIYDSWGRRKLDQFRNLGLDTEILWEKTPETKGLSGTDIRLAMMHDEPWEHLVPEVAGSLMRLWNVPERLKRLARQLSGSSEILDC